MPVRLRGTFVSERGRKFSIEVLDTEYAGDSVDVEIGGEGFLLTYEPEEERPDAALIPSSLEFTVVQTESTSSDLISFRDDYASATEEQFRVKVAREDNSLYWVGYAMPDQLTYIDPRWADTTVDIRITAKDGLNRLKGILYNDSGAPYSGRETFKNHLFNCLEKIGLNDFYNPTDPFLTALVRWYEDQDLTADEFVNEMDRTYVDHLAYISYNDNSLEEYTSTYDVLKDIVTLWGARLYIKDGTWRFEQWNEYQTTPNVKRHVYQKDRVKVGTESEVNLEVREDADEFITAASGVFGTLPLVKGVEVTHKSRDDRNYLQQYQQWDTDTPEIQIQLPGKGKSYLIRGSIKSRVLFDVATAPYIDLVEAHVPVHAELVLQMTNISSVNPISLSRPVLSMSGGAYSYDTASWDGGQVSILMPLQVFPEYVYLNFSFFTPPVPDDNDTLETFTFRIDFLRSLDVDGQVPGAPNAAVVEEFEITDLSLQVINADGSFVERERKTLTGLSANASGGEVIQKTVLVADTGAQYLGSTGVSILVDGSHEYTASWKKGRPSAAEPNLLQRLLAIEIFKRHKTPLKTFDATFYCRSNIGYSDVFTLTTGERYVALQASYNSFLDAWSGVFAFIGHSDTIPGGTTTSEVPTIVQPPGLAAPNNNGASTTAGGVSSAIGSSFPDGGHIVSTTGSSTYNDGDEITAISINAATVDGLLQSGDTIAMVDRSTGNIQHFTVTSDLQAGDTTISVSPATISGSFRRNSYITLGTGEFVTNIRQGSAVRYVQKFDNPASETLTVTENNGTLPIDTNLIDVYYNGVLLSETDDYSISGSDILLTFSPKRRVIVKFWIIA